MMELWKAHGPPMDAFASRGASRFALGGRTTFRMASRRWRRDFSCRPRVRAAMLAVVLGLPGSPAMARPDEVARDDTVSREPRPIDMQGLRRDTSYFLGYQFVAVALIGLWPRKDTNYDAKDVGWDSWRHNVTHPQWDEDRSFVNYVLHPYWGAGYYVRARERGLDRTGAFWYSALLSTLFEFGAEAIVENVSYQDLVVTPILGSLLGHYFFWPMRERILNKTDSLDAVDRITLVLTDPLGTLNSGIDRLFGVEARVELLTPISPMDVSNRLCHAAPAHCLPSVRNAGGGGRWGVQLRLRW
ncbi:DUF3943 domain-containing protein [Aquabacterium sp. A7-Y]|uniref:DUF3943 domain-containing protein n=1 Tax=Aquabacterium sp. A7-Y TaxID=1349605 RepID=UPI00223E709E|nr:DUF3943 domain-containing protein [Aquabacterium sp. A7-Y]MCW7538538.1 DUF3943 domain-containing protein [Aquabacterium sp. A7-Y]